MVDDVRDFRRREARVHGHHDRPELQHPEVDHGILDAVRCQHGDAIAAPHPESRQRVREPVRKRVEVRVRDALRAHHVRGLRTTDLRVPAQDVAQDEHRAAT